MSPFTSQSQCPCPPFLPSVPSPSCSADLPFLGQTIYFSTTPDPPKNSSPHLLPAPDEADETTSNSSEQPTTTATPVS